MYSCKEVTELISRSHDQNLGLRQKLGLYIHLSMCKLCSQHKKQMAFLKQLLDKNTQQPEATHHSVCLSHTKKEEIKKCIREHTHP